jgi:hypothetical protein
MQSPALQLLKHIIYNTQSSSYTNINISMQSALELAISAQLKFEESDFQSISTMYQSQYWLGDHEKWYTNAIICNNRSAIKSFETWKKRKPYIIAKAYYDYKVRNNTRLFVGAAFSYQGILVKVTSFAQEYIIACSYKPQKSLTFGKANFGKSIIQNRIKISNKELILDRKFKSNISIIDAVDL